MHWRVKYLIQRNLSFLPGHYGHTVNHWLSVNFGGLNADSTHHVIHNTLAMSSVLRHFGFELHDRSFVEIGTGWTRVSAMTLLALGAREVYSFDLHRHLDHEPVDRALRDFANFRPNGTKPLLPFPCDLQKEYERLDASGIDLSRFHYVAPHDARATGLESNTIDGYFSHAVLEHVARPVIEGLLVESFRILKPGGFCYHFIQPTMHAAWMDAKATGIDYLTCSDRWWRVLYENDVSHECRLRGVDHLALVRGAGFEIVAEWHTIDQKALAALPEKKLAEPFRSYSAEEICTDYIWIVGRKFQHGSLSSGESPR